MAVISRLRQRIVGESGEIRPERPPLTLVRTKPDRIEALDFARGIAILLMIQSHGVKGLLGFEQIPAYGLVPIHLATKFSSSLFILVFGMALAAAYVPRAGTAEWPRYRNRLLLRGVVVLFWYKLLTVIEMLHLSEPEEIVAALLYKSFPVFSEILGFYGLALLWVPLTLPLWKKIPLAGKPLVPLLFGLGWYSLAKGEALRGNPPLRAILLEEEGLYVWGQLPRGALVFVGLFAGELALRAVRGNWGRTKAAGGLAVAAAALGAAFYVRIPEGALADSLAAIARNQGKHPPAADFMLFSLAGAFGLLALAFLGGNRLASWLRPVTIIGKNALAAFVFHIFAIFLCYRYLLQLWRLVTYEDALVLTGALMVMTALWVWAKTFVRENS